MEATCSNCNRLIRDRSTAIQLMGKFYHKECLKCQKCQVNLTFNSFVKKGDDKLYCGNECGREYFSLPPIKTTEFTPRFNSNSEYFRNNMKPTSSFSIYSIMSDPERKYPKNPMLNGFFVKKPLNKQRDTEPFNYNREQTATKRSSSISNTSSYQLKSPFASLSLNEFDKNAFLTKDKKIVYFKLKSLKSDASKEPFDYNKQSSVEPIKFPENFVPPDTTENAPYATHKAYLDILENSKKKPYQDQTDTCTKCKQTIKNSKLEGFTYMNRKYHKECLRCLSCKMQLFTLKKILHDPNKEDNLFCEQCYNVIFAPKCPKCAQPIASYMLTTRFEDKQYHKECFYCQRCKNSTANEQYFNTGHMILCRACL